MEIEKLLKENIFRRAKLFIDDMGHFAPFCVKIKKGTIIDVVINDDFGEIVDVKELILNLKRHIKLEFKSDKLEAGAIAYDVTAEFLNSNNEFERRDALCLLSSQDGVNWQEEYFPYSVNAGQCFWK